MLQPRYRPNFLAFLTVIVSSDRRHATQWQPKRRCVCEPLEAGWRNLSRRAGGGGCWRVDAERRPRPIAMDPACRKRPRSLPRFTLGGPRDLTPYLTPYGADADAMSGRAWIRNPRISWEKRRSGRIRTWLDGPECDSQSAGQRFEPARRLQSFSLFFRYLRAHAGFCFRGVCSCRVHIGCRSRSLGV